MSAVSMTSRELVIELTTAERVAALHRDIRFPLSAIAGVEVVPDALAAVRGWRAPGLALPGRAKIGTWRRRKARSSLPPAAASPTSTSPSSGTSCPRYCLVTTTPRPSSTASGRSDERSSGIRCGGHTRLEVTG